LPIVSSGGQLESIDRPFTNLNAATVGSYGLLSGGLDLGGDFIATYSYIYRTQPNVRTVIDFFGRNVAQLGLHLFARRSDSDRRRLATHPFESLIRRPAGPMTPKLKITRYAFIESLTIDKLTAGISAAVKVRDRKTNELRALLRVPPDMLDPVGGSWLAPEKWRIRGNSGGILVDPEEILILRYHHPRDPRIGLSRLETLRLILAEEYAAGAYRQKFWKNAARMEGFLKRPPGRWNDDARIRFKEDWKEYVGSGFKVGGTPILEDGMEWQAASFSAKDAEYLAARKLTREECATAFFIPPPMVGILEHATFSNITEQHKMLYQDALGPELVSTEEDFEVQLFPDFADLDPDRNYLEFNIAEKMKGSFEEQADALMKLAGRPLIVGDEGRARLNLNALGGSMAKPVVPMNMLVEGEEPPPPEPGAPAPEETPPPPAPGAASRLQAKAAMSARRRKQWLKKHRQVLGEFLERQADSIRTKTGAKGNDVTVDDVFDLERWNDELSTDLFSLSSATAEDFGSALAEQYGSEFDETELWPFLTENSGLAAEMFNDSTRNALSEALGAAIVGDAVKEVLDRLVGSRLETLAQGRTTTAASFGASDAIRQAGGEHSKTWLVTSKNPRRSHAAMSGETVPVGELFSNGGKWPGDPSLSADELAGCTCLLEFD
jgi:HK97 family phage portal protein